MHINNPSAQLKQHYYEINVLGTENIVQAALKFQVRRLVFFSTIAVYGQSNGQILTEESNVAPQTIYGATKLAAEQIVLNARLADGTPLGTVLRLGAVYGTHVKGNYQRLFYSLERRRFIPLGKGINRRTLVYDRDVATATLLALEEDKGVGRIYNVSDGQIHTVDEITQAICTAIQRPLPRFSIPLRPVILGVDMLDRVTSPLGIKLSINRAMLEKYTEDIAVSSQRIQTELGFKPQYDLVSGWREVAKEYRI